MKELVVDASVIISWFLPDEANGKYETLLNNIDKIKIHVPSIFEHEFMNILLNAERNKRLDKGTSIEILGIVSRYPITIESSTAMLMENINVFEMARAYNLTAYDAAYLELAVRLSVPLITYDKALLETARKLKLRTSFLI
jgi:predicted nucleic acid-binding protein